MKLFDGIDFDDAMFVAMMLLIPSCIGGAIGGCVVNSAKDVSHSELANYASAVSNRLDKIEFGLMCAGRKE